MKRDEKSKSLMKPLTSSIHFNTAIIEKIPVAVFTGQEMIGSGKNVEITDFAVKIGDEFYVGGTSRSFTSVREWGKHDQKP
ncbi:hypothetical protein BK138_28965 [Paenibacillus rhizosphaerae]|uniref:Uncharacterized protein n=1 Tax=Paenibacillus rhizosphaerae TaxID=297318 RepID=A0A1R1ECH8_9BACL|nr:hypothetical protein [Paenibacillus rhizosphaerae]OMF49526.1 hypothetical protein BK138_28965 [Paenibacillus rhizosphaerae]